GGRGSQAGSRCFCGRSGRIEEFAGAGPQFRVGDRTMTRKGRRIAIISTSVGLLALAAGLVLFALRDNVVFFYTPSEVSAKSVAPGTRLRLGGLVKMGSIERSAGNIVKFVVTDSTNEIAVSYVGLLPDLFREGQGVVTE